MVSDDAEDKQGSKTKLSHRCLYMSESLTKPAQKQLRDRHLSERQSSNVLLSSTFRRTV